MCESQAVIQRLSGIDQHFHNGSLEMTELVVGFGVLTLLDNYGMHGGIEGCLEVCLCFAFGAMAGRQLQRSVDRPEQP